MASKHHLESKSEPERTSLIEFILDNFGGIRKELLYLLDEKELKDQRRIGWIVFGIICFSTISIIFLTDYLNLSFWLAFIFIFLGTGGIGYSFGGYLNYINGIRYNKIVSILFACGLLVLIFMLINPFLLKIYQNDIEASYVEIKMDEKAQLDSLIKRDSILLNAGIISESDVLRIRSELSDAESVLGSSENYLSSITDSLDSLKPEYDKARTSTFSKNSALSEILTDSINYINKRIFEIQIRAETLSKTINNCHDSIDYYDRLLKYNKDSRRDESQENYRPNSAYSDKAKKKTYSNEPFVKSSAYDTTRIVLQRTYEDKISNFSIEIDNYYDELTMLSLQKEDYASNKINLEKKLLLLYTSDATVKKNYKLLQSRYDKLSKAIQDNTFQLGLIQNHKDSLENFVNLCKDLKGLDPSTSIQFLKPQRDQIDLLLEKPVSISWNNRYDALGYLLMNNREFQVKYSLFLIILLTAFALFLIWLHLRPNYYRLIYAEYNNRKKSRHTETIDSYVDIVSLKAEKASTDTLYSSFIKEGLIEVEEPSAEKYSVEDPEYFYDIAFKTFQIYLATKGTKQESRDVINKALDSASKAIDVALNPFENFTLKSKYYKLKTDILKDLGNYADASIAIAEFEKLRKEETLKENVSNKYKITKIELNNVPFFGTFSWNLTPGVNILLGKNGYGKSHFLGLLASLLYEHNGSVTRWIRQTDTDASATLYMAQEKKSVEDDSALENNREILRKKINDLLNLEMDLPFFSADQSDPSDREKEKKKESLKQEIKKLSRSILLKGNVIIADNSGIDVNGQVGKIPLLAIPDSRLIDKSKTNISKDYASINSLLKEGAKNFIELTPFADSIIGFLQNLAKNYHSREDFKQEPYLLIKNVIEELSGNKFEWIDVVDDGKNFQFHVQTEGSTETLPLQVVSQGTFSVLAMVGTIYAFLQEMYPETKNFKNEPAIVIIDEIDAHLHPSWHQKLIGLLRRSFPGIQFILTAHSPLVIAGAYKREAAVLRKTFDKKFSIEIIDRHLIGVPMANILKYVFGLESMDENFMKYDSMSMLKPELESELKKLEEEIKNASGKQNADLEQMNLRLEDIRNKLFYIDEVQQIKEGKSNEATKPVAA